MTNKEAIDVLTLVNRQARNQPHEFYEALALAIKALEETERNPTITSWYDFDRGYEKGKASVEQSEVKGDLISRNALKEEFLKYKPYAVDFLSLIDNAPTVELTFKPIAEVKIDKEQLQEIVDKAKAEVLASVERPQGEWLLNEDENPECPFCHHSFTYFGNFCGNCGADLMK